MVPNGQTLQHTLSITNKPADPNRADEPPESVQESLTVANRLV